MKITILEKDFRYSEGDKVIVENRINGHGFEIGEDITIVEVREEDYLAKSDTAEWCIQDSEIKSVAMPGLEKYYGKWFNFAEEFTCNIEKDGVYIEEYSEGKYELKHIKTEDRLIKLYEILTGNVWDGNVFITIE